MGYTSTYRMRCIQYMGLQRKTYINLFQDSLFWCSSIGYTVSAGRKLLQSINYSAMELGAEEASLRRD